MEVCVVTPTIGSDYLNQCISSVDNQTYDNIKHYIFCDGKDYEQNVRKRIEGASRVKTVFLEENVGQGWYGHRVYSACSFLVNGDVIVYLDEDNWLEPNHVQSLVEKIQKENLQWAYSLRKIYDKQGKYLCEDNCESLGKWPVYFNNEVFHIDTSSFAVRRDVAVNIGHAWYGQWGADRQFFNALKQYFPKYNCTNEHSLCYRLDGNPNSVKVEFFEKGNSINDEKYSGNFPWKEKSTLESLGPGISLVI